MQKRFPFSQKRSVFTRECSPLGAVTMVPPGGWSLVDNKRNTHTSKQNSSLSLKPKAEVMTKKKGHSTVYMLQHSTRPWTGCGVSLSGSSAA